MTAIRQRTEQVQDVCNAFVTLDWNQALSEAERCDRELRRSNDNLPPYYGVPFSVKDLLDTKAMRTTYGSRALATNIPTADVEAVARMRRSGGILIGKTTTPEFAVQVLTDCDLTGTSRNPWDVSLTPGGSSGGAGIAAATGAAPLAVSTDGGGSSRIPAAACGILGLKVTLGAIPHESWPFLYGNNSSVSINCKFPTDLIGMFNAMSGAHALDPWSRRPIKRVQIPKDNQSALQGRRALFLPNLGGLECDAPVLTVVERMLQQLVSLGLHVDCEVGNSLEFKPQIATHMMMANIAVRMRALTTEQQAGLGALLRPLLADEDYLPDGLEIQQTAMERSRLYARLESVLESYDMIITPTLNASPPPANPSEDQRVMISGERKALPKWWSHLSIANLTGHPAISVPCGIDPNGMPVGLHAVGRWDNEQQLVDLAFAISSIHDWTTKTHDLG